MCIRDRCVCVCVDYHIAYIHHTGTRARTYKITGIANKFVFGHIRRTNENILQSRYLMVNLTKEDKWKTLILVKMKRTKDALILIKVPRRESYS